MKFIAAILFLLSACTLPAMDRFVALSMLESGDNDKLIGPCGERSRYQISPAVAVEFDIDTNRLFDPQYARTSLIHIMAYRGPVFRHAHHRAASDFEFYLLWHCPAHVNHPNKAEADLARRFANLCARQNLK